MLWWIIGGIIILILFFIAIMIYLYDVYRHKSNQNKEQQENAQLKIEQLENIVKSGNNNNDNNRGPIGPEGPQGPQGPSGGIFTDKGPLRNLAQPSMVADRMDGFGAMSRPYLANQNYQPQQTWTLTADTHGMGGLLENKYGGCMAVDGKNNGVYMMAPSGCKQNGTKWLFNSQGNLVLVNDPKKCLGFTNMGMIKNLISSGKVNLQNKSNVNQFNNLLELSLSTCDPNALNQKWSFY